MSSLDDKSFGGAGDVVAEAASDAVDAESAFGRDVTATSQQMGTNGEPQIDGLLLPIRPSVGS